MSLRASKGAANQNFLGKSQSTLFFNTTCLPAILPKTRCSPRTCKLRARA